MGRQILKCSEFAPVQFTADDYHLKSLWFAVNQRMLQADRGRVDADGFVDRELIPATSSSILEQTQENTGTAKTCALS